MPAFAKGHPALVSTLRLWLVFLACAGAAALLAAGLQRGETVVSRAWLLPGSAAANRAPATSRSPGGRPVPPTAFAPTFADAAASLRAGQHAVAYGRFVALADEGDVDAARIALVMHRFGPDLFDSDWDASADQLAQWTRQSAAAAEKELALLRAAENGPGAGAVQGDRDRTLAAAALSPDHPPAAAANPAPAPPPGTARAGFRR